MSLDIQRGFVFRLIAVSVIVSIAWMMIVGPRVHKVDEMNQVRHAQDQEIAAGEEAIGHYSSRLGVSMERMSRVRDHLVSQLDASQSSNTHKLLQDSAESHDLTVSRIEPMRTTLAKSISDIDQSEIHLETKEFRVECAGPYAGIVGYLEDLSSDSNMAKASTFRIIPVGKDNARMIVQVSIYQLIEIPEAFTRSLGPNTMSVTDAGDGNGDL